MGKNIFYYSFRYFLFLVLVLALSYSFYPNELPESADSDSPQNHAQKILRYDASAVVKLVPIRVLDQNRHTVQTFLECRQNRSQTADAGIIPEKNPQKSTDASRPDMTAKM